MSRQDDHEDAAFEHADPARAEADFAGFTEVPPAMTDYLKQAPRLVRKNDGQIAV
jgi:hypothetical protein